MSDDIDLTMEDILGDSIEEATEEKEEKTEKKTSDEETLVSEESVIVVSEGESKGDKEPTEDKEEMPKVCKDESVEDLAALAGRLELWNKSCRDLFMDLRTFKFMCDEEEMCLVSQDKEYFDRPLYFKSDPENPKDPRIFLSQKQFCKMIGVPHSFFMQNRPKLKMDIVKSWQAGLDTDSKKARCIARIRESKDYCVLRAIVGENHALMTNYELIKILDDISKGLSTPLNLEFATGDHRDDLVLHARCLFGKKIKILDTEMQLGFSVLASELGDHPLVFDVLLHHTESKTSYIASYGSEPFFSSKYDGIQTQEIKEIVPKMIERIEDESGEMADRIEEEQRNVVPREECISINTWKGLSSKFKRALFHEAAAQEDDMKTAWDFARHMSLIAKDADSIKRLSIERAAGYYLNLTFSRG